MLINCLIKVFLLGTLYLYFRCLVCIDRICFGIISIFDCLMIILRKSSYSVFYYKYINKENMVKFFSNFIIVKFYYFKSIKLEINFNFFEVVCYEIY